MSDFWTRRRAAAAAETRAEEARVVASTKAAREAELAEMTDEELCEAHDLPDPKTLDVGDDFTRFMQEAVPARLRTMALRRLWRVNPALANLDGLIDYGEDFTIGAKGTPGMKTSYRVGKGMLAHVEEMARQALARQQSAADGADDLPEEEVDEHAPESVVERTETLTARAEEVPDSPPEVTEADGPAGPPRHRMQFEFEDTHRG